MKEYIHSIICLIVTVVVEILFQHGYLAGSFVCMFFAGREHAQAEERWIEKFGNRKRENMPWYAGFDNRVWDADSFWFDLMAPVMQLVVSYILQMFFVSISS